MPLPLYRIIPLLVLGIVAGTTVMWGQDEEVDRSWEWGERSIVIVKTTKDYNEALELAQAASSELDIFMDLRDLHPDSTNGLSWTDSLCEENGWEGPCYVARGRFDNGVYISIEYSSAYQGFAEGYYIVVVASGAADANDVLKAMLKKTKMVYKDAYMKKTMVYMGCMH